MIKKKKVVCPWGREKSIKKDCYLCFDVMKNEKVFRVIYILQESKGTTNSFLSFLFLTSLNSQTKDRYYPFSFFFPILSRP